MSPDFRALCAELVEKLDALNCSYNIPSQSALVERAHAALSQPKPVAPKPVVDYSRVPKIATEAQIRAAAQYLVKKRHCDGDLIPAIEYAIARWGTPAIQPVPVSERPWEREGWCDAEGQCWWFRPENSPAPSWYLDGSPAVRLIRFYGYTHSLPHHALPTPDATND